MATFLSLYNDIEHKIKQAALYIKELKGQSQQLQEENNTLKMELDQWQKTAKEWQEKYNLLTITQTILKKEDRQETKKKINDLVREINRCIEILNK
jgi:regulator of replication initiation timing